MTERTEKISVDIDDSHEEAAAKYAAIVSSGKLTESLLLLGIEDHQYLVLGSNLTHRSMLHLLSHGGRALAEIVQRSEEDGGKPHPEMAEIAAAIASAGEDEPAPMPLCDTIAAEWAGMEADMPTTDAKMRRLLRAMFYSGHAAMFSRAFCRQELLSAEQIETVRQELLHFQESAAGFSG